MDNALIVDLALAGVLLLFAVVGARRGLVRSLMLLVSTLLALVGAAMLTAALAEPVTDMVFPTVREKAVIYFEQTASAQESSSAQEDGAMHEEDAFADMTETLRRFGISDEAVRGVMQSMGQSAVSTVERAAYLLVKTIVQAALFLLSFLLLLLLLRLVTRALDAMCRLPVLHGLNTLGGVALSLAEGALVIYLVLYAAPRLGVTWFTDHAEGTVLLAWLMKNTPYSILASLI